MNKEEAYELATMRELGGNPNGTRQDVVWRAMDIYSKEMCIEYLDWAIKRMNPAYAKANEVPEQAESLYNLFLEQR